MTALGTFLPFARSGQRARSSYELVAVARRLDVVPQGWPSAATRLWFLVPLAMGACWLLAVGGRSVASAICALGVSAAALIAVWAVWRSPLDMASGSICTAVGALALISSAAAVLVTEERGGP